MPRNVLTAFLCIFALVGLVACSDEGGESVGENRDPTTENADLHERSETMDATVQEMKDADSKEHAVLTDKVQWPDSKGEKLLMSEDSAVEITARLAEDAGGEIHYVEHAGRGDRTVLVLPQDFVDGETPLIVSLHGFGGNSADHAAYFPFHERVNSHGFALLLPNGLRNAEGLSFWNPTDECCQGGKSGEDDVGYLTELVEEAQKVRDFGPIIFFGYSNGGFMAYHMACKGLPGLRAVVSVAGTSYVDDSNCQGSPPINVLHIHGTDDSVIMFEGDSTESDHRVEGEPAFYIGAQDMVARWSRIAGCEWPENSEPYATRDLDDWADGAETSLYRLDPNCTEGISIELWMGEGSSHSPDYGDAFINAVLEWLLAQQ